MPSDSGKTVAQLQADIDQTAGVVEAPQRRTVARRDIFVAEEVFQWRGDHRKDRWARENHIYILAKALRDQAHPLDPLEVFQVEKRYYVIDGHHRLAAYDTAKWSKAIPVEVFSGTLTAARLKALKDNSKDKLPMTSGSKSEAAWRIVKENLGNLKADAVGELTGVSRRQVFYMKKVWKELHARQDVDADQRAGLMKLTWKQATDLHDGVISDNDFDAGSWKEQKAEQLLGTMRKHNVATGLLGDVEVTALALHQLDEKLPQALIEEWTTYYPELFAELAERIKSPPPDLEF